MLEDPVSFSFMHLDWQLWLTFTLISMIFIQHLIYSPPSNLVSTLPLFLCGGLRAVTGVGGVLFGRRFLTTTSPVSVVSFPSYSDHCVVPFLVSLLFCFKFTSLVFGLHLYVVFTSVSCVVPFVSCSDVHMHCLCCLR